MFSWPVNPSTAKALTPIRKEYTLFFIVAINDLEFLRPLEVAYVCSGFINDQLRILTTIAQQPQRI